MRIRNFTVAVVAAVPWMAFAHPGHASASTATFLQGFLHPLTGADHLAAMLAVGLWSGLVATQRRWLAPAGFAGMLLLGALALPSASTLVESGIAASLLVLGLMVATRAALPPITGALLVGGFAFAHGAAHGSELQGGAALLGMLLATVLLQAGGLVVGSALRERARWAGVCIGSGVAVLGAASLFN